MTECKLSPALISITLALLWFNLYGLSLPPPPPECPFSIFSTLACRIPLALLRSSSKHSSPFTPYGESSALAHIAAARIDRSDIYHKACISFIPSPKQPVWHAFQPPDESGNRMSSASSFWEQHFLICLLSYDTGVALTLIVELIVSISSTSI